MARGVFALLVGIDAYESPIPALDGCGNDMRHLEAFLRGRLGDALDVRTLLDADATRDAVVDGFRSHLGRAGTGDVALFAYAGHGSQELAGDLFDTTEASGSLQNLVLVDAGRSRTGAAPGAAPDAEPDPADLAWPLADKELGMLLTEVAARGAHVVALLDCCHSGDGTRDVATKARQWVLAPESIDDPPTRAMVAALKGPRPATSFLDGTADHARDPEPAPHVALYACQSSELAKELIVDDEHRGAFTATLLDVLENSGEKATYRSVLATVRSRLERQVSRQRPSCFPVDAGSLVDGVLLDGTVQPAPPSFIVTRSAAGWSVDAGSVHGLRAPVDGEEFRLACYDTTGAAVGQVRVTAVDVGRSSVEPLGWEPADTSYRAVISAVPLPPAAVSFDEPTSPDGAAAVAAAFDAVRKRLATCGPDGGPSPAVRERSGAGVPGALALRVAYDATPPGGPSLRVLRPDGSPAVPPAVAAVQCGDAEQAARTVVAQLEHVARWEQLRGLGDHRSALDGAVQLRIYPAGPDEPTLPPDRQPAPTAGEYRFAYAGSGPDAAKPRVFMRLANTTERPLYAALLDLTDQLDCAVLYQTQQIAPGQEVDVNRHGAAMRLSLSDGVDPVPGASSQEWLKIVTSESEFAANEFELAGLGAAPVAPTRSADAPRTTLERLAARATTRKVSAEEPADAGGADWSATTVALVVEVPAGGGS